jgi:hypothetical protein
MGLINIGKDMWLKVHLSKVSGVSEDAMQLFDMLLNWSKNHYDGTYRAHVMVADVVIAFKLKGKVLDRPAIGKLARELAATKVLSIVAWEDGSGHEYILGEVVPQLVNKAKQLNDTVPIDEKHKITGTGEASISYLKQMMKDRLEEKKIYSGHGLLMKENTVDS